MPSQNLDDESTKGKKNKAKEKSPLTKIIIAIVAINAAIGGYLYINKNKEKANTDIVLEKKLEEFKPYYFKFNPVIIVNIPSKMGSKFLQIEVQVMSRKKVAIESVEAYAPSIRNDLIKLFSAKSYDEISTTEGKDNLRKEALLVIQKVIAQHTSDNDIGIEEVLFTSFITQ